MWLSDASVTPTPTFTPAPTHHFIPTRTPTPFVSPLVTPTPPVSGVETVAARALVNDAWILNVLLVVALIGGLLVDKLRKRVYNKHARVSGLTAAHCKLDTLGSRQMYIK